jgi:hypothetical protein
MMTNDDVKTELNVGDVVYRLGNGTNDITRSTISRVTATMAIVERKSDGMALIKFTRAINGGALRRIGDNAFSMYSYRLENPELARQYNRAFLVHRFNDIDVDKLTDDQLRSIIRTAIHSLDCTDNVNMLTVRRQ